MHNEAPNKLLLKSLLLMASVVEARDPYTGGHLWRVSQLSELLAKTLKLPTRTIARVKVAAYLHDLGKVGISDQILRKPDKLTEEEYESIKTHPQVGYEIVKQHPIGSMIKDIILNHHERIDGKGYPNGLNGAGLNVETRIVSICDAFDALTSARPYRKNLPIDQALFVLNQERDKQFDGQLLDQLNRLAKSSELQHIVLHSGKDLPMADCPKCGPILTVSHQHKSGDVVNCRECTGAFKVHRQGDKKTGKKVFKAEYAGYHVGPKDLAPSPDQEGVNELLETLEDD